MDPKYKRNPFGSYSTNTFEKISGIVSHPLEELISSKLPQARDVTRSFSSNATGTISDAFGVLQRGPFPHDMWAELLNIERRHSRTKRTFHNLVPCLPHLTPSVHPFPLGHHFPWRVKGGSEKLQIFVSS